MSMDENLLRRKQETYPLETFFMIKLKAGHQNYFGGPYLDLHTASKILMENSNLIMNLYNSKDIPTIGYIEEYYLDANGMQFLMVRATEVFNE